MGDLLPGCAGKTFPRSLYAPSGTAVHEEAFDSRPNEPMTEALTCGVSRARLIAAGGPLSDASSR
ncbi:hypothetical protein BL240_18640 [Pseudomonas putida]|uniref:Uncharacterized protein n=1 Tax=Pseudomonas putida TaxID=303 RepID=A0A1L5PT89_PSEPU|nr:hypothetical protein BL240_18640 [Pseudomonas putida]